MIEKEEYVTAKYCSAYGEMTLASLALLCQELATEDVERRGYDRTKTLDLGFLWVIGKQRFEIARMPRYEEKIKVVTYPGKHLAAFFLRHYRVYGQSGELLVKGVSVWGIIDKKKRTLVDPEQAGMPLPVESQEGELDFPKGYPPFEGDHSGLLEATYSRCDVNGHLNNTKYFDFALDHIPLPFLSAHRPSLVDIAYKKEIPLGNKVDVHYGEKDGTYYFSSSHFDIRIAFLPRRG